MEFFIKLVTILTVVTGLRVVVVVVVDGGLASLGSVKLWSGR